MARWKGGGKDERKGRRSDGGKEKRQKGERKGGEQQAGSRNTTATQNRERELQERVHIT